MSWNGTGTYEIEKKGRHKIVVITDKGKYAACLIGRAEYRWDD